MPYTEAQNKATQKYSAKAYDQIKLVVKKGEREKYKALAERRGKSLNALIVEYLEQECLKETEKAED